MPRSTLKKFMAICAVLLFISGCGGGSGGESPTNTITPAINSLADISSAYPAPVSGDRPGGEHPQVPIMTSVYIDNAQTIATVFVQHLSHAHLGIWAMDNTFDDDNDGTDFNNADDGLDYQYRWLSDNQIANLPATGLYEYLVEADVIYKGRRFYPDNVGEVNYFQVSFYDGTVEMTRLDIFGGITDYDPDDLGEGGALHLGFRGTISADGTFSGSVEENLAATGFFSSLEGQTGGTFSGAFFDAADYDPTTDGAPAEVGGIFEILDADREKLTGGFLGVHNP